MNLVGYIDVAKLKRGKVREAIQFALSGRWREAILPNQEILHHFPYDLESLNRLGKAFLEVGNYPKARESFRKVLSLSPHNSIAKKNLNRLSHLPVYSSVSQKEKRVVPKLFLEETGKTGVTELRTVASESALATVASGDVVKLEVDNNTLVVKSPAGDVLGYVEPKLGSRLAKLVRQGNEYEVAVLNVNFDSISVIIKEVYRNPNSHGVCSFPASGKTNYSAQIQDNLMSYELDAEPDEESRENPIAMWTDDGEEVVERDSGILIRATVGVDDSDEEI